MTIGELISTLKRLVNDGMPIDTPVHYIRSNADRVNVLPDSLIGVDEVRPCVSGNTGSPDDRVFDWDECEAKQANCVVLY